MCKQENKATAGPGQFCFAHVRHQFEFAETNGKLQDLSRTLRLQQLLLRRQMQNHLY